METIPTPPPHPPATSIVRSVSDINSSIVSFNRSREIIHRSTSSYDRIGEIAGSTAAECAAVACCFPCGVVGLMVCAVVKLPAGLCKRAYIRRRRRRMSTRRTKSKGTSLDEDELNSWRMEEEWEMQLPSPSPAPEVVAMDHEMWTRFRNTGFWRSPSQRDL